jgi:hypothetical protein
MPNTILDTVRQPLANAFANVAGNVYAYVPEAPMVPFVVTVPDLHTSSSRLLTSQRSTSRLISLSQ